MEWTGVSQQKDLEIVGEQESQEWWQDVDGTEGPHVTPVEPTQRVALQDHARGNDTPCGLRMCLGMNAPKDLIPLISEHWYRYPPPTQAVHVALGSFFCLLTLVSFCGNLTVIVLYCKCKRLQRPSNLLVAHLAAADLLMMAKAPIFAVHSFMQRPVAGRLGCDIYGAVSLLAGLSAIWFLTAISVERYRKIRYGYLKTTFLQVRFLACLVWIVSSIFTALPLLGWNRYVPEGVLSGCTVDYLSSKWHDRTFVLLLVVLAWMLPMATVLFSYISIAIKVHLNAKELRVASGSRGTSSIPRRKMESQVLKTGSLLTALWITSWTPYVVVLLIAMLHGEECLTPLIVTLPSIFCKASACFNPYIYGLCLPAFRKELPRVLRSTCWSRRNMSTKSDFAETLTPPKSPAPLGSGPPVSSGVQQFMLPNGDVIFGLTYTETKKRLKKKRHIRTNSSSSTKPASSVQVLEFNTRV